MNIEYVYVGSKDPDYDHLLIDWAERNAGPGNYSFDKRMYYFKFTNPHTAQKFKEKFDL